MSRVRPVRSGHDTLNPAVGFGAVVSLTSPLLTDAETMASDTSIPETMSAENLIHDALLSDPLVTNTSNRDARVPKSTPRGTVSEGSTRDAASTHTNPATNHYSRPLMPKSQTTVFENNPSLPVTDYPTTTSLMPNSTSMPTFLLTPSSTIRPRPTRRPQLYSDHHTMPPDASNRVPAVVPSRPPSYDYHTPVALPPPRAAPSPSTPLSLLSPSSPQFYLDHTPATSLPHLSPTTPQSYNNHTSDTPGFQSVFSPTSCQSDKGHSPNTSTFQLSISSTTPLTNTCNTPTTASAHSFPTSPQSSHSPNTTTLPHLSPTTPQSHPSHSPVTPQTYSSHTTHSNPMSHTSDGIPNDSASGPIFNILSPDVVDLTNTGEKESSPLPSPYSPSFPTPSPSFLTEDGTEVRVEDLIHLGSGEGTRVREGRSGSRKGRIRAGKPQHIEKKRNREKRTDKTGRETPKGEILEDANVRRKKSDDGLDSKERDLEACWTHLLSPHFLSPPPSPTSSLSGSTKNHKSDLNTEGCVEPECKKEVFKNILYDEGSDETDDCGRLLKKEKKERKRLKKEQKRLKKAQQTQSREQNGPIHTDNQAKTKKKRRRKQRHGERPTPLDLLSDQHDHVDTRDDPTLPCFRRLNLPMIDDDPGHDYRLPDPSSTPSSTTSSSSSSSSSSDSSSSLSFDLDILGPEAAEWAEQLADVTVGAGCFIKEEMEEVVHILTEPEDRLEFEWFDAITGLVSIVTFYFDLVSDGLVLFYMTDDPASKRFFLPTLLLTVIPMVLANGFSLYWYWFDERGCVGSGCHPRPSASRKVWTLRLVAHTLLQASVLREVDIIYYGTKSTAETVLEEAPVNEVMTEALRQTPTPTPPITTTTTTRPVFTTNTSKNRCGGGWCVRRGGYVALWLHSERDAANVELILALLRDAPLLLLHLYALELTLPSQIVQGAISHTLVMQMLSVVMSFLELAWAVASYIRASHLTEPSLPNFSYLAVFLLTLTHFCSIAGQVMSLSLCASRVLSVFFVVAGIHWGLMSAWIFFQLVFEPRTTCTRALFPHDKVQGSCHRLDDALYSLVMGLVFLFTFVDVGGAPSATRAKLYQVFTLLEQLSLLTVWLVLSPEWAWYHILPLVLSPLLFCFSLTFDTLLSIHITPTHCLPLAPPSSPATSKNMKIMFTSPKSV